jgi:hypothetical protein
MPGAARMTVTGKIGPASALTATVLTGVTAYSYSALTNVLAVQCDQGLLHIDINAATTWTCTISSGVQTLTIS